MRPPRSRAAGLALVVSIVACSSTDDTLSPTSPTGRLGGSASTLATTTSTATVSSTNAQVIKGWGLYPAGGTGAFWDKAAIENAVYAIGATFVRERVDPLLYISGTTIGNMVIDTTLLDGYVSKLQSAQAHGVSQIIFSVWSPPPSMKTDDSQLGYANGTVGYLAAGSEDAFVAFVTKVMLAFKAKGINPSALAIQNEPEYEAVGYDGTLYPVAQWQNVIEMTRGAFDYNGLASITTFGPETGTYGAAIWSNYYTDTPGFFGGPTFPDLSGYLDHAVGAYAFHMYGECNLWQMQTAMAAHPKDAWMDEFSELSISSELLRTLDTFGAIGAAFVILPFNYWAWWNGYASSTTAPDGGSLLGGTSSPIYTKRYWALKKLWTTVRPGWHVRSLTTTDPDLQVGIGSQDLCSARVDLAAFVNASTDSMVVMLVNTTTTNKTVTLHGLLGTSVTPYRTDASIDMEPQTAVTISSGAAAIYLPTNSVVLAVAH
jgi:O-glycosyl hydrolase